MRRGSLLRPAVLFTTVFCVVSAGSLAWIVMASLKTNGELFSSSPWSLPSAPSIDSYNRIWESGSIPRYLLATIIVTVTSVLGALCVSSPAAYAMARIRFRGKPHVRMALQIGIIVPAFTVVIPVFFMLKDAGALGSYVSLVLVYVAIQIPFTVFVLTPFFERLPREIEEAAFVDGASALRMFVQVMLPLVMPSVVSVGVLNAIFVWNEFFFASLLQGAGGADLTLPLGLVGLAGAAEFRGQWVELLAGVVMSTAPVLVLFALFQRRIEQSLTAGALK